MKIHKKLLTVIFMDCSQRKLAINLPELLFPITSVFKVIFIELFLMTAKIKKTVSSNSEYKCFPEVLRICSKMVKSGGWNIYHVGMYRFERKFKSLEKDMAQRGL